MARRGLSCPDCGLRLDESLVPPSGPMDCPQCSRQFFPHEGDDAGGETETFAISGATSAKSTTEDEPAPRRPRKRKRRKAKPKPPPSFIERIDGNLLLWGSLGLLLLLGSGVWWFATSERTHGTAPPNPLEESTSLAENVDWFGGDFYVYDDSKPLVPQEPEHPSFAEMRESRGVGPNGKWIPFDPQQVDFPESGRGLISMPLAANSKDYLLASAHSMQNVPRRESEKPAYTAQLWCQRFSWETNEPVGRPRLLGSGQLQGLHPQQTTSSRASLRQRLEAVIANLQNPQDQERAKPFSFSIALSHDSRYLASEILGSAGIVRVWKSDSAAGSTLSPTEDNSPVRWIGWNTKSELIVLSGTRLQAYSPDELAQVWSIDCQPESFVTESPARDWVAVASDKEILLVDIDAGKQLGTLPCKAGQRVIDVAVSPDGLKLAAVFRKPDDDNRQSEKTYDASLIVWELKSGTAFGRNTKFGKSESERASEEVIRIDRAHFGSPGHLLVYREMPTEGDLGGKSYNDSIVTLYDVSSRGLRSESSSIVAFYDHQWEAIEHGPYDRPWLAGFNRSAGVFSLEQIRFLDPKNTSHQKVLDLLAGKNPADEIEMPPLRLEIDAGSERAAEIRSQGLAQYLSSMGVSLAPGGYTLRVRLGIADSGKSLSGGWSGIRIPKVVASYKLFSPDGKEFWSETVEEGWHDSGSRYAMTENEAKTQGLETSDGGTYTQYWNFTGGDPWTLMYEEICESRGKISVTRAVPGLLRGGGDWQVDGELRDLLVELEKRVQEADRDEKYMDFNDVDANRFREAFAKASKDEGLRKEHRGNFGNLSVNFKQPAIIRKSLTDLKSIQPTPKHKGAYKLSISGNDRFEARLPLADIPETDFSKQGIVAELSLPEGSPPITCFEFSDDGKTLHAFASGWMFDYDVAEARWTNRRKFFDRVYRGPLLAFSSDFSRAIFPGITGFQIVSAENPENAVHIDVDVSRFKLKPDFIADGEQILAVSAEGVPMLWDARSGESIAVEGWNREPGTPYDKYSLSKDKTVLAVAAHASEVAFYKVPSFEPAGKLASKAQGTLRGDYLFVSDTRNNVTSQVFRLSKDDRGHITGSEPVDYDMLNYNFDKGGIVAGADGTVYVHGESVPGRTASRQQVHVAMWNFETGEGARTVSMESTISVRDLEDRKRLQHREMTNWIALSNDETHLAMTDGKTITVVDLATPPGELAALEPAVPEFPEEFSKGIVNPKALELTEDSPKYQWHHAFLYQLDVPLPDKKVHNVYPLVRDAIVSARQGHVWLETVHACFEFNLETHELVREFWPPESVWPPEYGKKVIDPAQAQMVVVKDNNLFLVRADEPSQAIPLDVPRRRDQTPSPIGFSPDGAELYLHVISETGQNQFVCWDIDRERVTTTRDHPDRVEFSYPQILENGNLFFLNQGRSVAFLDARRLTFRNEFDIGSNKGAVVSDDLKTMAFVRGDRSIGLVNSSRGFTRERTELEPKFLRLERQTVLAVGLSADGKVLASLSYKSGDSGKSKGELLLTDTETLKPLAVASGLPTGSGVTGRIPRIRFTADGQQLWVPVGHHLFVYDLEVLLE